MNSSSKNFYQESCLGLHLLVHKKKNIAFRYAKHDDIDKLMKTIDKCDQNATVIIGYTNEWNMIREPVTKEITLDSTSYYLLLDDNLSLKFISLAVFCIQIIVLALVFYVQSITIGTIFVVDAARIIGFIFVSVYLPSKLFLDNTNQTVNIINFSDSSNVFSISNYTKILEIIRSFFAVLYLNIKHWFVNLVISKSFNVHSVLLMATLEILLLAVAISTSFKLALSTRYLSDMIIGFTGTLTVLDLDDIIARTLKVKIEIQFIELVRVKKPKERNLEDCIGTHESDDVELIGIESDTGKKAENINRLSIEEKLEKPLGHIFSLLSISILILALLILSANSLTPSVD
jgi:hypothetical protein